MNSLSPHSIKAVVFDLDDTLIVSRDPSLDSVYQFLLSQYVQITRDEVRRLLSEGALPGALRKCFRPEAIPQAIDDFAEFAKKYVTLTHLFPGVLSGINELRDTGTILAILSARPEKSIRDHIGLFPEGSFRTIIGCDSLDDGVCKPNPEALESTLERIQVSPEQAIFVGDSGSDMKTSYLANVPGILVKTGGLSDEQISIIMQQFPPAAIVKDIPELVRGIRTDTLFSGKIPSAYDMGWGGD